ncbi:MAG: nuclear transport factor 2 family protein [Pseudomonadota bacterium]
MKREIILSICLASLFRCTTQPYTSSQTLADQEAQLALAERAWLDAYDTNDRLVMSATLAEGFTITFPDGRIDTRDDVINGLDPTDDPDDDPTHYTEDRTIRVIGNTAILSGVYVNPGDPGEADDKSRYTDTWMLIEGQWKVVASHLSDYRADGID